MNIWTRRSGLKNMAQIFIWARYLTQIYIYLTQHINIWARHSELKKKSKYLGKINGRKETAWLGEEVCYTFDASESKDESVYL